MSSSPTTVKNGCGWTRTWRKRSPGGPPLAPGSPWPASLTVEPSRRPGGTLTSSDLGLVTIPEPRQPGQMLAFVSPVPWHVGQGSVTWNDNVRLAPRCKSSTDSAISASTSCPRRANPGPALDVPALNVPPPPKSDSKKSLKPRPPRDSVKMSPKSRNSYCCPLWPGGGVKSAPAFQLG